MTALELIAVGMAALVGGAAQAVTGFGVALPIAPTLFAIASPPTAVLMTTAIGLVQNVLTLALRRGPLTILRADAVLLLGAAAPGVVAGASLVRHLPASWGQVAVGVAVGVAVIVRTRCTGRAPADVAGRASGAAAGAIAGGLTTTVGLNGPPIVLWLSARRASPAQLRDTLAVVFLALNLAAIAMLSGTSGEFSSVLALAALPGLVVGQIVGRLVMRRVDPRQIGRLTILLLAAAALVSIGRGLSGLLA